MQIYEQYIAVARCKNTTQRERHAAFAQLVAQFHGGALRYAHQLLRDEQLAQDATQEALLLAYQRLSQLQEPAAFPGWLLRIVHSQCHRIMRGSKNSHQSIELFEEEAICEEDFAEAIIDSDSAQRCVMCVLEAIRTLPEHERSVVQLFYLEGEPIRMIAEKLAVPVTTVKKRLQYARNRLHKELQDRFHGSATSEGWTLQSLGAQLSQILLILFCTAPAELQLRLIPAPVTCVSPTMSQSTMRRQGEIE